MEALTEVVRQGKARYLGFSEWPPDRIQAALDLPGVEKFVSSQPQYSILWREPEREVFPLCAANGISQIVWSPLAQGALTGKYKPGEAPPAGTRAASQRHGLGDGPLPRRRRARGGAAAPCRSPTVSASRWLSSRSRGCSGEQRSPPRSSARAARSRSRRTRPPRDRARRRDAAGDRRRRRAGRRLGRQQPRHVHNHPLAGVRDVEQDVHGLAGADEDRVLQTRFGSTTSVAVTSITEGREPNA